MYGGAYARSPFLSAAAKLFRRALSVRTFPPPSGHGIFNVAHARICALRGGRADGAHLICGREYCPNHSFTCINVTLNTVLMCSSLSE